MKNIIFTCLFTGITALMLSGCMSVNYIGKEYPETKNVRIFFNRHFVPLDKYEVMGHGEIIVPENTPSIEINHKFISKGKDIGADAVLILNAKALVEKEKSVTPAQISTEPNSGILSGEPATKTDGEPIAFNDMGYQDTPVRTLYEYETAIKVVYLKRKPEQKPAVKGVNVKDLIASEKDGSAKVQELVNESQDAEKAPYKVKVQDKKATENLDSQEEMDMRNRLDNLKMDLDNKNKTNNVTPGANTKTAPASGTPTAVAPGTTATGNTDSGKATATESANSVK